MSTSCTNESKGVAKIHYFPVCGRADFIKVLYEDAGKPYEFISHDIGAHKALSFLPFGQLPVLVEPCGNSIGQTGAIVRHVAKQFNLYPSNASDAVRAESLVDQTIDIIGQYFAFLFGKLPRSDLDTYLTNQWTLLEAFLTKSESKGEFVTGSVTFADICLWHITQMLKGFVALPPLLSAHNTRIGARPKLAAYVTSTRFITPITKPLA